MLTIRFRGGDAHAALQDLQGRLRNLRPALEDVGEEIQDSILDAFRRQRSPYGAFWNRLSPVTLARRRGGGKGARKLLDTGRLRNSFTVRATSRGVTVGTNVVYARTHQFGNPRNRMFGKGPAPIPARPFMMVTPDGKFTPTAKMQAAIRSVLQNYLDVEAQPRRKRGR